MEMREISRDKVNKNPGACSGPHPAPLGSEFHISDKVIYSVRGATAKGYGT